VRVDAAQIAIEKRAQVRIYNMQPGARLEAWRRE
jgi:hypothetical protein